MIKLASFEANLNLTLVQNLPFPYKKRNRVNKCKIKNGDVYIDNA